MKIQAMLIIGMLTGACSGGDAPAPAPQLGTVSEANLLKDQVDAIAKAKEAEKMIQEAADKQRREIEAGE